MMPMRNRRIRLLLLAVLLTITFLLYSRSDPTTIQGAKHYAQQTYKQAYDRAVGKSKTTVGDVTAPLLEEKKDEPFRVDFGAYSRAADIAAGETIAPANIPPPAQPVPPPPAEKKEPAAPLEPKKDDPMRVDFAHYSKQANADPEETQAPDGAVIANPNPIAAHLGAQDNLPVPKPKLTTAAAPKDDNPKQKSPDRTENVAPIGEGRVEIDVDATPSGQAVHWSKLVERFPPTSTIPFPFTEATPIPKIQHDFKATPGSGADTEKLAAIKAAAVHSWKGYREKAMGHDEVKPISGKYANPFNAWGATLVDSLDTLWLMGMVLEFEEALDWVKKIDFTTSKRGDIPLFETTIRYMGGLLGAYEISSRHYQVLLDQAKVLGDILYGAFDTPNRMPMTYYQWKPAFASQGHRASVRAIMAEIGSLGLEFTRLGQLTAQPKYYDAIARITNALEEWQPKTRIPGLWPTTLDASGCKKSSTTDDDDELTTSNSKAPSLPKKVDPESVKPPTTDDKVVKGAPIGGKEPGLGKIAGFGKPIEEGSLDSQAAKDALFQAGITKKIKRALDAVDSVAGSSLSDKYDPSTGSGAFKADAADSVIAKTDALDKPAVNDQSTGSGAFKADSGLTAGKSDTLSNSALSGVSKEGTGSSQQPITDDNVCIPQGLASSHEWSSDIFTFGAAADSTYEYLPKMHLLLGGRVDQYASMYKKAIAASKKWMLYRPMIPDEKRELLFAGNVDVKPNFGTGDNDYHFSAIGSHLTCFVGGMFAMGGKIFNSPEDVAIGAKLTDGCIWAYNSTATGIMPEIFGLQKCESTERCKWDQEAYYNTLDPHAADRLAKGAKAATPDPQVLGGSSKADAGSSKVDTAGKTLNKRQFGGGEMQYGMQTGPDLRPGAAATIVAEVPPLGMGNSGLPASTPQDPTIKMPYDAGAAPKLSGGVPAAAGAGGNEPYPASPDASVGKPVAIPEAKAPAADSKLSTVELDKKPVSDVKAPAAGSGQSDSKISPVVPGGGLAPTVPDAKSGASSFGDKVAPAVPDTGLAPTVPGTSKVDTADSKFGSGPDLNVADTKAADTKSTPSFKELTPSVDEVDETHLSHEEFVQRKIAKERLPPGMIAMYDKKYLLRPEAIESVFYMYRITGEQYWRDRGWEMWTAINKYTHAPYGATAIEDVSKTNTEAHDSEESFWLAETLKYFYLLFDDPDRYSLDDWVLNTEAHFLSRLGS